MKIGIITDTHDKEELVDKAIAVFVKEDCKHVFHCGDFESPDIFNQFNNKNFKFYYVTGPVTAEYNHDKSISPKLSLSEEIQGLKIGAQHTIEYTRKRRAINEEISREYDYFFYGHFHFLNLKLPNKSNKTVFLNSGGFDKRFPFTFCILDTDK